MLGPFDGQILDRATGEPVSDAVVVGIWSYDRGDGFIGPYGSESVSVQTDDAGRYRIPRVPLRKRGSSLRLVSFQLVVYKRGYVSYRSDARFGGGPRRDFTGRHNRIELDKWRERDSHAEHLLFLAAPREVARVSGWERRQANVDLYEALSGSELPTGGTAEQPDEPSETPAADTWLDASAIIYPEDVAMRTGFDGDVEIEDLGGLPRTVFYHGILFRAVELPEDYDFSYRVWHKPSGGLDPVIEIFNENFPVEVSDEVTPETWVYVEEGTGFTGVAFIDRESESGVLVSCGPSQCIDVDTTIILAKYIQGRLDRVDRIPAPEGEAAGPGGATEGEPAAPPGDGSEAAQPDASGDALPGAAEARGAQPGEAGARSETGEGDASSNPETAEPETTAPETADPANPESEPQP